MDEHPIGRFTEGHFVFEVDGDDAVRHAQAKKAGWIDNVGDEILAHATLFEIGDNPKPDDLKVQIAAIDAMLNAYKLGTLQLSDSEYAHYQQQRAERQEILDSQEQLETLPASVSSLGSELNLVEVQLEGFTRGTSDLTTEQLDELIVKKHELETAMLLETIREVEPRDIPALSARGILGRAFQAVKARISWTERQGEIPHATDPKSISAELAALMRLGSLTDEQFKEATTLIFAAELGSAPCTVCVDELERDPQENLAIKFLDMCKGHARDKLLYGGKRMKFITQAAKRILKSGDPDPMDYPWPDDTPGQA